jgi:CopG family nickel-responsive transcriptional regulator
MSNLIRFGVSIDQNLLEKFDLLIKKENYQNRSEAIRDLIRESLVKEEWEIDQQIIGAIALVYDHHQRRLINKLLDIEHTFHIIIISSQHIHIDHDNCLEIMIVKGGADIIKDFYNKIKATKGVKHVDIIKTTSGKELS